MIRQIKSYDEIELTAIHEECGAKVGYHVYDVDHWYDDKTNRNKFTIPCPNCNKKIEVSRP